jgi:hypothetical protein
VAQVVQALEEFVAELGERQSRDAEASPPVRPKPGQRPVPCLASRMRLMSSDLWLGVPGGPCGTGGIAVSAPHLLPPHHQRHEA